MRALFLAGVAGLCAAAPVSAQPVAAPPPAAAVAVAPEPGFDLDSRVGNWSMMGPRVWANAEYRLIWVTGMNSPDLIQAVPGGIAANSVNTGTALPAGAAVRVFPEGRQVDFGSINGVKANAGVNFERFGIDVSGFTLDRATASGSLFNNGLPQSAAVGYVQAATGTPISLFASLAGDYTGGVAASVDTKLWGFDTNLRLPCYNFLFTVNDALAGFRYVNLEENLNVNYRATFKDASTLAVTDAVRTRNQFYGGQVGLDSRIGGDYGLGAHFITKLAVGGVRQRVELAGSNTFGGPGVANDVEAAGLFARPANQGVFTRDKFACVMEYDGRLTYNFNPAVQVYVGYTVLFLSSVQRPGEAIDPVINDARVRFISNPPAGTANRPAFEWRANDFTAQGITFGAVLQY
jgi:hypothetical protein